MSLTGTLNNTSSLGSPRKQLKTNNFFIQIDAIQGHLSEISKKLVVLQEECTSVTSEKNQVQKYLEKKSEQNRLRLMQELSKFQDEVRIKIESAKRETAKIDEKINDLKNGQIYSLQMVLAIQRKVHQIEVQVGFENQ